MTPHEERMEAWNTIARHVVSTLIVGAIIFVATIAVLGVVNIESAVVSGLVVQVINTLKDLFKGPSYNLYGVIQEEKKKGAPEKDAAP